MNKILNDIKRCKPFLKDVKKEIVSMLFISIIPLLVTTITPYLNGEIINQLLKSNFKLVLIIAVLIGVLKLVHTILGMKLSKIFLDIRKKVTMHIQRVMIKAILDLNIDIYSIYTQGSVINKIKDDSKNIVRFLNNIKEGIFGLVFSLAVIIYIFSLNNVIGILYALAIVIVLCCQFYGIKKTIYYNSLLLEASDENSSLISDIMKGSKDIKSLNLKEHIYNDADSSFDKINSLDYKVNLYKEYTNRISSFLSSILLGIVFFISIILIKHDMLSVSTFIIIFMYKGNVFVVSNKLSNIINNYELFNLSLNRIYSVLEYKKISYGEKELNDFKGNIELKNVSFKYDNKWIFQNFNLKIAPNSLTCIVGENGAGKSTLFMLLAKLLTPKSGSIYFDEFDIDDLTEDSIRNNISLVTQQPFIFDLSIKKNLSMIDGKMGEIENVCKLVGLDEKIKSLPKGYNTKITNDASNLSGGEKQKLAIARALLSKTKVLLLDEITNNLDKKTVDSILDLLLKLKNDYTIIMITHNEEAIKKADRVVLLKDGCVVEDGKWAKIQKSKQYHNIKEVGK